jgi:hypothetical protein
MTIEKMGRQDCKIKIISQPVGGNGGIDGDIDCGGAVGTADGASAPVVIFSDDVVFDDCVLGIPQICDSVVLTDLSFDDGSLGSHIAAFCSC